MNNKAQAAMEFLMTYGWAILAAIIALGILSYFGVFSPGKYSPTGAVINPPFYASGALVHANSIDFEVQNNGGENLVVKNVSVSGCGSNSTAFVLLANEQKVVTIFCASALTEGESFRGDVSVVYNKQNSVLDLTTSGTIAQKVTD